MSKLMELWDEFTSLKNEVFEKGSFVVLDQNDNKVKRYYQLLGFFYPQFKTSEWVNPLEM